jgi:2-oxoglutarate ferredoxin oxidoreductase subunit alpha
LSKHVNAFIVAEINYGQMACEVERHAGNRAETVLVGMMGGTMHTPEFILDVIEEFTR